MKRTVLYLDIWPGDRIQEMKLAGIRRFAAMRGWNVVAVPETRSRPAAVRALLAKVRPLGCIVEASSSRRDLRPPLFGGVPAVWLDCRRRFCGGVPPMVVHDGEATTRAAFRELSANRPDAYAVVGCSAPRDWSAVRERTFRALAAEAGKRCFAFVRRNEDGASRAKRLAAFVARLPRKTAVFAVNDATAREVADACRRAGKSIPSDLSLLGVDNIDGAGEGGETALSSVQIDFERAGYLAAKLLDARIADDAPRRRAVRRGEAGRQSMFGPLMVVRRKTTRGFGRREPRLLSAVETIRREACSGLTASAVLKTVSGSRRLAELRFREMMGHSILDEIMSVRFERACFLLSRTDTAIGAIAAQCGFGSDIALYRAFRRRFGTSLRAWRKANRSE